jgi:parallel beta-helix repeat protein
MKTPKSVIPLIIWNLVCQTNLALARILIVPEEFPTVQQAISTAASGDTIEIRPGIYQESITLKSDVNLFGTEPNEVVIRWDSNATPVADIQNCRNATISGLTFMRPGENAPLVADANDAPVLRIRNSSVKVTRCRVHNSISDGIAINGNSQSEISECNSSQNARSGIAVGGSQARLTIRKNLCSSNGWNGITFTEGAGGLVEENICSRNAYNGISVMKPLTSPKVIRNICSDNNTSGIWIGYGARGEFQDNVCTANAWHGISIADNISSPLVQNNQCTENKGCGIYYTGSATTSVWPNIVKNNGQIDSLTLRQELLSRQFDELEETANNLRTEKRMFSTGTVQLEYFYSSLSFVSPQQEQLTADKAIEIVNDWIRVKPDSVTPRIVLANIYTNSAWQARGGGWGRDVSPDSWKVFRENLQKAWEVLTETEKLNQWDPELYKTFIRVGMGLGKSDTIMNRLVEKGIAIDKEYYPIYNQRALSLMPRWGGNQGQLAAFAQRAADLNGGDGGEIMYARMVAYVLHYFLSASGESFDEIGFSPELAKRGHMKILAKYPRATFYLNSYCLLACFCLDKDTAKTLFDRIGDDWDRDVWRKEVHFNTYRDWAYGRGDIEPLLKSERLIHEQPKPGSSARYIPVFLMFAAGGLAALFMLGLAAGVTVIIILLVRRKGNKPGSGA